jgi:dATP pyrophosphohydrolase
MSKKIPVSAQVIIFCSPKQILLLQRKDNPNYWQSITGSIEKSESPWNCAIREVYEETALDTNKHNLFDLSERNQYKIYNEWAHRYEKNINFNIEHIFALHLNKKENIIINPEEHLDYAWFNLPDAIEKVFSWTNRKALIKFKELYE